MPVIAQARDHGELISFGVTTCAPNWPPPNPGRDHFRIANRSAHAATVYLFKSASGTIVAKLADSPPHSVRQLTARLRASAMYTWGCDLDGYPRHISDARRVPPQPQLGGSGPQVVPVLAGELVQPMLEYRSYVSRLLGTLQGQVTQLAAAVDAGDVAAAQGDWLTAHLTWLDIGQDDGAYGTFGELGRQIDGTAAGLVQGTADPGFTGFHKVEFDLWTTHDLSAATSDAAKLHALISKLVAIPLARELPLGKLSLTNFTLRCHEVLEDALRDSLSADDDYGSGTDLASVTADVAATRELLGLFAPLIEPRAPPLVSRARRQLNALIDAVDSTQVDGQWVAIPALPLSEREAVDGVTGAVLETLAPVPDLLRVGVT